MRILRLGLVLGLLVTASSCGGDTTSNDPTVPTDSTTSESTATSTTAATAAATPSTAAGVTVELGVTTTSDWTTVQQASARRALAQSPVPPGAPDEHS